MRLPPLDIRSAISVSTIMRMSGNISALKKTIAICISLLFFMLLAPQLTSLGHLASIGFNQASAQLGGSGVNNSTLNLEGIWERIDDDTIEDWVYMNQEGTQITATFEPIGHCYEDPENRIEGTEYASQKLVFRGNLSDNTIQGIVIRCLPDERTTTLMNLSLTVSADGRTLDGYITSPDGQQHTTQYVFISNVPLPSIEISTDKSAYDFGERVEISGQVTDILNTESNAFIEVYGPVGEQAFATTVPLNSDGTFSTSFVLNDQISDNGTHTAVASYAGANAEVTFDVQQDDGTIASTPQQDSNDQMSLTAPTRNNTESIREMQVQCIHTPILPQANQGITITAKVVDESAESKVADSIEIEIKGVHSNRTEPLIVSQDSTSRFNYTVGPFTNLTTINYGCRSIDSTTSASVFTGWKTIVIGDFNEVSRSFNESRAVYVPFTGDSNSNLDILFIADNEAFSSPTDPDFLIDVETAIRAFYNQSVLLKHQNKTNFWIAQDMAQANGCDSIPPVNWNSEYLSFEYAVILHRDDSIRDCTEPGTELSTANMATVDKEGLIVLHELGHRPFGLGDEYDWGNPSGYLVSHPYQNIFSSKEQCNTEKNNNLPLKERECREIPYSALNQNPSTGTISNTTYFTTDPKPNDIMSDHKQFQELDIRRVEKWFEGCLTSHDILLPPTVRCESGIESE